MQHPRIELGKVAQAVGQFYSEAVVCRLGNPFLEEISEPQVRVGLDFKFHRAAGSTQRKDRLQLPLFDAARLQQRAEGYLATIVSGEVTYRNGEATTALPGRLIRGAQ